MNGNPMLPLRLKQFFLSILRLRLPPLSIYEIENCLFLLYLYITSLNDILCFCPIVMYKLYSIIWAKAQHWDDELCAIP